ncbi:MAG: DUF5117 domain-containing protein [Gemmatimonadales bacterium]|nr:MAG: DUF5117 domain-containing protein [Gemmatimonadales bacterium]
MRVPRNLVTPIAALAILAMSACSAREAPASPSPEAAPAQTERPAQDRQARPSSDDPTPYSDVITDEAETKEGLFKVHMVDEELFFEIPVEELGKDMMIMARQDEGGFGNRGNRTVRWERRGDRIDLRTVSFNMIADENSAISRAVDNINRGNLIASFEIETFGEGDAPVIQVTRLFRSNIPEFIQVSGLQGDRSWIDEFWAFPENINITAVQTGQNVPGGTPANTVKVTWSMIRLPEDPMMPRLHDSRVGFMSMTTTDYSRPEPRAEQRRYIRRFRLEKEDPSAEMSDPVKPIEFWIDPATPEWLVPWTVRGVEQWVEAYEEAGFSNAIVARIAPDPEEDPSWSPHDARHSMIYWRPSTTQNATGGNTVDPRTGEIIKAEVNMYHNVMNLVRNWYFTQAGPLDERAQQFPMPDSIIGAMVEYVVAHEVGHAIGFPHNMKASAMYPADSIRSRSFLERKGSHVATLMDYSRLNYVAQPEDNIPPELLIPKVGPYDRYAVMWGHKPIPGATTPDEEWETLNEWSQMQDTIPWFRFTTPGAGNDPEAVTEAVGNADAVQSSTLGMRNLQRVMDMLLDVAEKPGQDYSLLQELYSNAVSQWGRYNNHVASIVGGAYTQNRYGTGERFTPVERERQQEALQYLAENAFHVPEMFLDQDILRRIESDGVVQRFSNSSANVFRTLISEPRLNRLVEYEAMSNGQPSYTVSDLLGDLRAGVWTELDASNPQVNVYRRSLQRVFVSTMDEYLNPEGQRVMSDARPIVRAEMADLATALSSAANRSSDRMTQLHFQELEREVRRMLDD